MSLFRRKAWRKFVDDWKQSPEDARSILKEDGGKGEFLRILLIGEIGVGKSAFINAVYNAEQEGRDISTALVGASESGTTSLYIPYKMEVSNAEIIDSKGLTVEDIKGERKTQLETTLTRFISGEIFLKREDGQYKLKTESDRGEYPKHQVHCVLFVTDVDALQKTSTQKHFEAVKDVLEKRAMKPRVILTKIDTIKGFKIEQMFHSSELKKLIERIAEVFSIDGSLIYPVWNRQPNSTDKRKNPQDLVILKTVTELCHASRADIEQFKATIPNDQDYLGNSWRSMKMDYSELGLQRLQKTIKEFTGSSDSCTTTTRILLVGKPSAGKSSFVNTLYSALDNKPTIVATCGGSEEGVTKGFRTYPMANGNIEIIDAKGIEDLTLDSDISDIIKFIENGPSINQVPDRLPDADIDHKVHYVAFVVRGTLTKEDFVRWNASIKAIRDHMIEQELKFVVIVTHIDKLVPNIDVDKIHLNKEVKNKIIEVESVFKCTLDVVFPIINPTGTALPLEKIWYLALDTFSSILGLADAHTTVSAKSFRRYVKI